MAEVIEVTCYTLVADPAWEGRLKAAKETMLKRTIPAYVDFCKEVHEFRLHCDNSQGGSEFSKKGCEWLGCDVGTLHRWEAVGRRSDELLGSTQKLPSSEHSIALIASLDDIAFPQALAKVQPDMSQKEVKALIKEIVPPRPKPTKVEQKTTLPVPTTPRTTKADPLEPIQQAILALSNADFIRLKRWINQAA